MYKCIINDEELSNIKNAAKSSPSVERKFLDLFSNPLAEALKTNIPVIGEYYINCGRYCLLYNVNEGDETFTYCKLVLSSRLNRVMQGKIPFESLIPSAGSSFSQKG